MDEGKWGSDRLRCMPKSTQLVGERARVRTRVSRNRSVSISFSIASLVPISTKTIDESINERWVDYFSISDSFRSGLGAQGKKSGEVALIGTIASWKAVGATTACKVASEWLGRNGYFPPRTWNESPILTTLCSKWLLILKLYWMVR